ncbi:type II toxin-antitoxin system RelE family toxin [Desulfonatronum lacustre]|uniref:type II toxin-antitoxin system RelE family toxin n=1 Tax=Desulfonatronum lacustre TaxID=66849 RepID=UPI00048B8EB8|nr:type II toxin-antitoxin system RelE/ParE family toxin [Desulfonatronum lacustre]SMP65926.1 mRNA interferase RelE/StbE [Desulfonatronum zhilinae]
MNYKLRFKEQALKEWQKLSEHLREQFKRKLQERLRNPHIPASRLSGSANRYKIKLKSAGYRLVYEVRDATLVIVVIAVGKRERGSVYKTAAKR